MADNPYQVATPCIMLIPHDAGRKLLMEVEDQKDLTTMPGRLWKARQMSGLTTKRLAAALTSEGVPANDAMVSRVENGQAEATLPYLMTVARIANVSLDWIVWGIGDRGRAGDVIQRLREELDRAEAEYVVRGAAPVTLLPGLPADASGREEGKKIAKSDLTRLDAAEEAEEGSEEVRPDALDAG